MIVVPPFDLTTANTTSTVLEPSNGEVVWSPTGSYTLGAVVIRTETHRKYELVAQEHGNTPPETSPKIWLDIGPTNKWAMFDNLRSQPTTALGGMTVVITPGKRVDTLALLGVKASKVIVTVRQGGNIIYGPVTRNMTGRKTTTWSQYFFGSFNYIPTVIFQDIPPVTAAEITVEFQNDPGQPVECSELVVGSKVYLGASQYDAVSSSLNFSRIERDDFGNSTLKRRRTVPRLNVQTWAQKGIVNQIRQAREDLNAVPALWSGLDDKFDDPYFEAVFIYGIYKQFEINLDHPSKVTVNLELEEM